MLAPTGAGRVGADTEVISAAADAAWMGFGEYGVRTSDMSSPGGRRGMSKPVPAPPVSRHSGIETCPCCGQQLLKQQAVRQLRKSELEFERKLETAVRTRVAEVENELAAKLEAEHQERVERLQGQPDVQEEQLATAKARYAKDLDTLRMLFRQF